QTTLRKHGTPPLPLCCSTVAAIPIFRPAGDGKRAIATAACRVRSPPRRVLGCDPRGAALTRLAPNGPSHTLGGSEGPRPRSPDYWREAPGSRTPPRHPSTLREPRCPAPPPLKSCRAPPLLRTERQCWFQVA